KPRTVDIQTLQSLSRSHPAWRLLRADTAPLVICFLSDAFLSANVRAIPQANLVGRLDDYLHQLRSQVGNASFPLSAIDYLDQWASSSHGWLRKYFPQASDEPHF